MASLANLKKRGAIIEPSRGRFQNDLPIFIEINVCDDILINGTTEDKWNLSSCIAGGWIEKRGDELFVRIPAFRSDEYAEFVSIVERELVELVPSWDKAATAIAKGYAELFPKHLAHDGARLSRYLWFSSCGSFLSCGKGTVGSI